MRSDLAEGILFTDQYQLAMAQLYFDQGLHERTSQFDYFFRTYPDYGKHQAGYCVFAGLEWLLDWVDQTRFGPAELEALAAQRTAGGQRRFSDEFLSWLEAEGHFAGIEIRSVAEGRVVHPMAPIVVVSGPLAMAQILETSLLNHLNYQTLIATKASRVCEAARGSVVLEFGMRRGPGRGANAGARAALIGGAAFTSNVGMALELGIDPKGTHGHSMVQAFMALGAGELEAFRAFARLYPEDCILLVDTIDTLGSGVPNAITVFEELRRAGHEPGGIRLDSGDLAYLAIQAARRLDEAGFDTARIVLSSSLDELQMWQILSQIDGEAPSYGVDPVRLSRRLVYGVGTRLITSQGHGALDGVCKLVAIAGDDDEMVPSMKLSDSPDKMPLPGVKDLWRIYDDRSNATADVIAVGGETLDEVLVLHHPHRSGVSRLVAMADGIAPERLLERVWHKGSRVGVPATLEEMRSRRTDDLSRLDPGVRRIIYPHTYHVSITSEMRTLRDRESARVSRSSTDGDSG